MRHEPCSATFGRAWRAPHSAVSELGVVRHLPAMSQQVIYGIQLFLLGSFVVSLFGKGKGGQGSILDKMDGTIGRGNAQFETRLWIQVSDADGTSVPSLLSRIRALKLFCAPRGMGSGHRRRGRESRP